MFSSNSQKFNIYNSKFETEKEAYSNDNLISEYS